MNHSKELPDFEINRYQAPAGMPQTEAESALNKLDRLTAEYDSLFADDATVGNSLLGPEEFKELLNEEKGRIVENSVAIGAALPEIAGLRNKAGELFKLHHYPGAEAGDFIHAVNWQELVSAIAGDKILKSNEVDGSTDIRFASKIEGGEITASELSSAKGRSYGKKDFPVAVRIPASIIEYFRSKEDRTGSKIIVEGAGMANEGYISAAEGQGLPLLFAEFGLPDGKWHTLLDLMDTQDVRVALQQRQLAERKEKRAV